MDTVYKIKSTCNLLFAFICSILISAVISCVPGVGTAPDLQAPELRDVYPENNSRVGLSFDFTGKAVDNVGVVSVTAECLETQQKVGQTTVFDPNGNWIIHVELSPDYEGEFTFLIVANDLANNKGSGSMCRISLTIDATEPVAQGWQISRPDASTCNLYTLEYLKNLDKNHYENINYLQNERFQIRTSIFDEMSVEKFILYVKTEDGTTVFSKTISSNPDETEFYDSDISLFAPYVDITSNDLKSLPEDQVHYLQLWYRVYDEHGNFTSAKCESSPGMNDNWIIWSPLSDKPGIDQPQMSQDKNSLAVSVQSSFPLDVFDDDALEEVYVSLLPNNFLNGSEEETAAITEDDILNDVNGIRSKIFSETTDKSNNKYHFKNINSQKPKEQIVIKTPALPASMYLFVYAKEKDTGTGKEPNVSCKIIKTTVTDSSLSMLVIESQENNEYPKLTDGRYLQLKGYVLGKYESTGLNVVYIPGNMTREQKTAEAERLFAGGSPKDGEVYESISLSSPVNYVPDVLDGFESETGEVMLKKQEFDNNFDILSFISTAQNNSDYFLMFRLTGGSQPVDQVLMLRRTTEGPVFEIIDDAGKPLENMKAFDYEDDTLTIRFKAEKKNTGLGINTTSLSYFDIKTASVKDITPSEKDPDGYYKVVLGPEDLTLLNTNGNNQPVFTFKATDALGTQTVAQRTFVLTNLPVLEEVTTDLFDGNTCKADETVTLTAKFSKSVKFLNYNSSSKPYINVKLNDTTSVKAYYSRGDGTNKLDFTFKVPTGVESDGIQIIKESENVIVLNENTKLVSTEGSNGEVKQRACNKLLDGKTIKLDGICPEVIGFNLSVKDYKDNVDGYKYLKKEGIITVTVDIDDRVSLNGNPELQLVVKDSSGNSKPILFTLEDISTESDSSRLTFVHTVDDSTPEGTLWNTSSNCFDEENIGYIADKNGNVLKLSSDPDKASKIKIMTAKPRTIAQSLDPSSPTKTEGTVSYYDAKPKLVLNNIENGCTVRYSIDDGVTWEDYIPGETLIPDGEKIGIVSVQEDKAGNISDKQDNPINAVVRSSFPEAVAFNVSTADGNYKYDSKTPQKITFTLNFNREVIAEEGSCVLNITSVATEHNPGATTKASIPVKATGSSGNKTLTFEYTVTNKDSFHGIKVTGLEVKNNNLKDKIGHILKSDVVSLGQINSKISESALRPDLVVDSLSPYLIRSLNGDENGTVTVTLKFDEKVSIESGTIILQRKGQWAIPAVMDKTEFNEIYTKLGNLDSSLCEEGLKGKDYQDMLIWTEDGQGLNAVVNDDWTGIAVGPYRKITHGIKAVSSDSNSEYVPDIETKFVLAFELGLYTGSVDLNKHAAVNSGYNIPANEGKSFTVANIRRALEKAGYHQHGVDVSAAKISDDGKTVEINFTGVEKGIEWELIIPPTAFRDDTGNYYAGMTGAVYSNAERTGSPSSDSTLSFWTSGVADPVIRVNRYSYGLGAPALSYNEGKDGTDVVTIDTVTKKMDSISNRKTFNKPTGQVEVRVDCETPGATITYGWKTKSSTAYSSAAITKNSTTTCDGAPSVIEKLSANTNPDKVFLDEILTTELKSGEEGGAGTSEESSGTVRFNIGTRGQYTYGKKMFVTAKATKGGINSENAYEGVYQTVVYFSGITNSKSMNIDGGMSKMGNSYMDGFPLKDATDQNEFSPYSKNMYMEASSNDHKSDKYVWVSYEILSEDIAILLVRGNFGRDYPSVSYGQVANITRQAFWD